MIELPSSVLALFCQDGTDSCYGLHGRSEFNAAEQLYDNARHGFLNFVLPLISEYDAKVDMGLWP